MERPDRFDIPFEGMEPRFYLSEQDVYRFLFRLGADNSHSTNFDMAVEELANQLPDVIAADMAAMESGETNSASNLKSAFEMFGTLAGLQFEGQYRLRNQLDIDDVERRTKQMLALAAVGTAAGLGTRGIGAVIYAGIMLATLQLRYDYVDDGAHRLDGMNRDTMERMDEELFIAHLLLEAGYPHSEPIPESLQDTDGNLLPPAEIAADAGLHDDFHRWVEDNEEMAEFPNLPSFTEMFNDARAYRGFGEGLLGENVATDVGWGAGPEE